MVIISSTRTAASTAGSPPNYAYSISPAINGYISWNFATQGSLLITTTNLTYTFKNISGGRNTLRFDLRGARGGRGGAAWGNNGVGSNPSGVSNSSMGYILIYK